MGKYVNGTFVPDENDLLLQQQQKMAVSQPAPVTQPNPEVAEFAKAKTNNQSNNSPRVAGQAGTVYNIFKQPSVEQAQRKAQPTSAPVATDGGKTMGIRSGEWDNEPMKRGGYIGQPITSTDELAKAMGYTSPEEEEKLRKASVANQRILAIGDALRQIGNIYNTTRYAPSQQFNSPVEIERQRYLQGKALRDKANQTYISYQQAKAKQDAQQRQWEAEFGLKTASAASQDAYRREQARVAAERAANQKAYQEGTLKLRDKLGTAQNEERVRHNKVAESQGRQRIGIQAQNAKNMQTYRQWKMNGGGGSGGRGGTLTFRGSNGFLSKKMSAQEANAFYNQAFDELSKMKGANGKPIIDKDVVAGTIIHSPLLGGNKINMSARKEAVDKAIYQHPEAGKFLQDKFEFELDPRGVQQTAMPTTQSSSNIKFGSDFWNSQLQQGGYGSTYTPDNNDDLSIGWDDDDEDETMNEELEIGW